MSKRHISQMRAIDQVVDQFPDFAATARRLYLKSDQFRSVCDDFALALSSLRGFQERSDAHMRPEIEDYRNVLRELESEIRRFLDFEEAE